jgi:hypothetical protein
MFDFIRNLFGASVDHAQVALHATVWWLPAPGWFVTASVACAIAAGLIVFFLKNIPLAIKVGIGAAIFAAFAFIGFAYEARGENNVIPRLNAAIARAEAAEAALERQREYAAALTANWQRSQQKSAALEKDLKEQREQNFQVLQGQVTALPPVVADQSFPAAAVRVLNNAARATSVDAPAQTQADTPGVAASDSGSTAGDSTVGAVTKTGVTWAERFKACRDQVIGWDEYFNSLF